MQAGPQPQQQPDPAALRIQELRGGMHRGWAFTPLDGKKPIRKGWSTETPLGAEELEAHAQRGNLGLRTGTDSGVVVIDVDEGADAAALDLPPTVSVRTGRGTHHYFRAPDGVRVSCSSGKLADHVDVRGDGGQVVFVGSVHPETGAVYRWVDGRSPDEMELADLPDWIVSKLTTGVHEGSSPTTSGGSQYGLAALEQECERVRLAPEGTRNDQLNRSAFALGQLVGGGELDEGMVWRGLKDASALTEPEANKTIESGVSAGMLQPRSRVQVDGLPTLLRPGEHIDDEGNKHEISEAGFARAALALLPAGALYQRAASSVVGRVVGDKGQRRFERLDQDSMRVLISEHCRVQYWAAQGKARKLRTATIRRADTALVLSEAGHHLTARRLDLLVNYPVHGCRPGWNESDIYMDLPAELEGLEPETEGEVIHSVLDELLVDFPFSDEASRQNFIGLMLAAILRPAISGNVPFHLVASSLERTGKTKLIEEVLGGTLLGRPMAALQLSGSEEEIGKRIMGLLLAATPIAHLDNLSNQLESPSLASLITASSYRGRLLGGNAMPELPNRLLLVGSGNNVQMSGELAKRTVPIELRPLTDEPESRTGFHHPDLRDYVRENRRRVLECLLGMIRRWEEQGRPASPQVMGGFEGFVAVVGGVMAANGFDSWLTNRRAWQRQADPHGEDLREFVQEWSRRFGSRPAPASDLCSLAASRQLFLETMHGSTEQARTSNFARRVLGPHKGTPVGAFRIVHMRTGSGRGWALEEVSNSGSNDGS